MKKQGFTLAEVLITLGIIGVVAAMTIPTLINNTQNRATATKLKKFYSNFNQSLALCVNENGAPGNLKATGLFAGNTPEVTSQAGDELVKYVKVLKNCQMAADGSCFSVNTKTLNSDGATQSRGNASYYKFIMADGVSVSFFSTSPTNCDNASYGNPAGKGALSSICGELLADVNGPALPNKFGKDTFLFVITGAGTIVPMGVHTFDWASYNWDGPNVNYQCSSNAAWNVYGLGCGGRIMDEGWEMNY